MSNLRKSKFVPMPRHAMDLKTQRIMAQAINSLLNSQIVAGTKNQAHHSDTNVIYEIDTTGGGGGQFKGEYNPTAAYAVQDTVVISSGPNAGSYVCIQKNTGSAPQLPDTGNLFWVSLSGNVPVMGAWLT
jgi:hypothetical protein